MESKPVTPLDEALTIARGNANEGNLYYDAFLNSDLYMPTKIIGSEKGMGRPIGWDEKFNPLFLPYEGIKVVPVFDQIERLNAWSAETSPDYVYLRCHVLLRILAPEVGVVVNLATEFTHYFPPDTLDRLRKAMQTIRPS